MPYSNSSDSPPAYEDALVIGILHRSGATPFPEAPRLGPRGLSTSVLDKPDTLRLLKASLHNSKGSSSSRKPESRQKDINPAPAKPAKHVSSSSGWQSDTSYVRSSKNLPPATKKKIVAFDPVPESSLSDSEECQIIPLLAYHSRKPLLLMDYSLPISHIRVGGGDIPAPLSGTHFSQSATKPTKLTSMQITISTFSTWTVQVRNKSGITTSDVLSKLRSSLYAPVSKTEWEKVQQPYRDRVKEAFLRRCRNSDLLEVAEVRNGLRRVDLLCENVIWKGLAPHPDEEETWILTLGSR